MAISEDDVVHLRNRLKEVVGVRASGTLISMFPPGGWDDVARIEHIDAAKNELRHEIAQVRSELVVEIAGLRVDMANLRAELKEEISGVRAELKDEITSVRAELKDEIRELRVEMHSLFRRQTNWIAGFMGTLTVSMIVALLR